MPEKVNVLYGIDHIQEELLGLKFNISPFSFFQTNTKGAESLYSIVREYMLSLIHIYNGDIILLEVPGIHISSTEIREKIINNEKVDDILPAVVLDIIKEKGLYREH